MFLSILLSVTPGMARHFHESGFMLGSGPAPGIPGNGVIDLCIRDQVLFAAGDDGIAYSDDQGLTWTRSTRQNGMGKGGISALDVRDGVIWAASGFDTLTSQGTLPAGGGVGYSLDGGESWQWFRQPVDTLGETAYKPTTTHVQNITYDLALTENAVWIASFGGGLRKSTDNGQTWEVITVNGAAFDALGDLTHRAFSVIYDGQAVWAGTAGGVHKSSDGGRSWTTFSHRNQDAPVSGNFVVALGKQETASRELIWASTWPTTTESGDETEFKAVSRSDDGGLTWSTMLEGESVHNFAFDGPVVYAATDHGVFMSPDYGDTWAVYPVITDAERRVTVYDEEINCVAAGVASALWVGTSDGLAMTRDNGLSWTVFQVYVTPGDGGEPATYACPNPFSPSRDRVLGEKGHCRFVYTAPENARISISIYDFGMNLVTTLDYLTGMSGIQAEPVWDGRNDLGLQVVNGVYFYRVCVSGQDESWGKVMVVD